MNLKIALASTLALVLVVFIAQNTAVVELRFLVFHLEMSRGIMIFSVFAAGIVTGWLLTGLTRRRR